MEKKKLFAPVWRHWKHAFHAQRKLIIITFVCYGVGTFIDTVYKPAIWKSIFDMLTTNDAKASVWLFGLIVVLSLVGWVSGRIGDYTVVKSQTKIIKYLKDYALQHLIWRNTNFFFNSFSGSLVAKVKRFAGTSENVYDEFVFTIYRVGIMLVGVFIVIFMTLPIIGVILSIWVVIYGISAWYLGHLRTPYDLRSSNADSFTTGHMSDILGSIHTIHTYAREEREYNSFTQTTSDEYGHRLRAWLRDNTQSSIQASLILILESVVMYMVIQKSLAKEISIGTVVMIQSYIGNVAMYMWNFGKSVTRIRHFIADAHEMAMILDEEDEEDIESGNEQIVTTDIAFSDVTFSYPKKDKIVLQNFSMDFEAGKRYGIVGVRGAGKTTLTRLLLKQFNLEQKTGGIFIGGVNIQSFSRKTLRKAISFVPQDPQFPFWSVMDIIRLGDSHATKEDVIEAAKKASCHDFIMDSLEHGYETKVGERGIILSGGQRQCLAIAAAFLKNAPIVILDEPTSALDAETESSIQAILRDMKGKTMIVIAHRLTTIAKLDEIIVLKDGSVFERGTHDQLLEKGGIYRSLWDKQFSLHNQM